jgi:hypothetical protein
MSYLYGKDGPEHPPRFTDMLGQEIRLGDTVAYSVRVGNVAGTKVATVVELNWREKMDGGYWEWKVKATHMSSIGLPRTIDGKPSTPSRDRMVRVAKGDQW